ncbi:hypothetical protein MKW94_017895 [Papaver nudicaule]|uniref:Pseudouridine synthase RsuA/RluA-like domain-containing protein n=1 Tax=Papaver nudicaule TaxID=74823 RepID=A0AA41VUW7_PAPNU|nr:hypothetical protein [Papaver nudicaule]
MAEGFVALHGRATIQYLKKTALASRICTSLYFPGQGGASYATAAVKSEEEEEEKSCSSNDKKKNTGKWFTLPPYTPNANDVVSVSKEFSRVQRQKIGEEASEPKSTMTAMKWVTRCCPRIPRSLIQKLFRLRQVRRDCVDSAANLGTQDQESRLRRVAAKDAMNCGDRIHLPVSVHSPAERINSRDIHRLTSGNQECRINDEELTYIRSLELYKDPSIIVINKPPGLPVQGGIGIKQSLDVLASTYLKYDYSEPPRLVHRLDRDSSGVLVLGRTQASATLLHSVFREKTFEASADATDNTKRILQRKYWALVIGTPRRASGLISAPLGKVIMDNGKSERITVVNDTDNMPSQHAVTEYRLVQSSIQGLTWIELSPLTGRKHQLRVHCAEVLGTPIVGDYKYGWQAHRNWKCLPWTNPKERLAEKLPKMLSFILDSESGSISEKEPHLHLHCRQMIFPDVHKALQHAHLDSDLDLSELENLDFVAPLPTHMQRSWDILNS